jgi:hypothetical protein
VSAHFKPSTPDSKAGLPASLAITLVMLLPYNLPFGISSDYTFLAVSSIAKARCCGDF